MRLAAARFWLISHACALWLAGAPLVAQDLEVASLADELKSRVDELRSEGLLRIGEAVVPYEPLTVAVYEQRGFRPLWTGSTSLVRLVEEVERVRGDGLDPESYHLTVLTDALGHATSESFLADRDLLATDALVRLAHDLRFGKVEPEGPTAVERAEWLFGGTGAVAVVAGIVASGTVREALAGLRSRHFAYRGLLRALAELQSIHASGGWEPIPRGPALALGDVDARVPLLRRRLQLGADLTERSAESAADVGLRFDSALDAGVRAFQHRHGLNEDGVVGSATLAALNVPVERRIEQVRVNLERARWTAPHLPDTFVMANAAAATVHVFDGDRQVFETRAIVGTRRTQTPVFTALLRHVELNPTWTVPPGIVGEVLTAVSRDPGYLEQQGIRVLDGRHPIDPDDVDFSRYTSETFPYVFRQDPGPMNALGRIKLVLPSDHHVYLHDTPARELFAEEERLFSHGCVRVEDPVGLAEVVLADPTRWNRAKLEVAIGTGATTTIPLTTPVPVFVLYWTAAADPEGVVHFYRDVYGRDARVLAALDAPATGTRTGSAR